MKITIGLIMCFLSKIISAQIIFDAEDDCKKIKTGAGTRYVPPCSIKTVGFAPNRFAVASSNSIFLKSPYITELKYSFQCNSLAPFSIKYDLDGHDEINSIEFDGNNGNNNLLIFKTNDGDLSLLNGKLNRVAFQVFKNKCKLELHRFISVPDESYLRGVFESIKIVDVALTNIYNSISMSSSHVEIASRITPTITLLDMLSKTEKNSLLKTFIITTMDRLNNLLEDVGDVDTALSAIRDKVHSEINYHRGGLNELYNGLNQFDQWALSINVIRDGESKRILSLFNEVSDYIDVDN